MAKGRRSALADLIEAGLVRDGELLRYKSKRGQLLAIGRAREGGIEVQGKPKLLGYTAFEDVSGSGYHRPAEHTHTTTSRNLTGLQMEAAGGGDLGGGGARTRGAAAEEPPVELLEDENDDLCHVCGLGGDLLCCEACPAVFHTACLGLGAPPAGDFYCPACRCTSCGAGGSDGLLPTACQWVDCSRFVSPDSLQQHPRPYVGRVNGGGSSEAAVQPKLEPGAAEDAAAAAAAGGDAMEVDGVRPKQEAAAEAGAADFSSLLAAATGAWRPSTGPAEAEQAQAAAQAQAQEAPGNAAVRCAVASRWTHLRCFPPAFQQSLRTVSGQPCISSQQAIDASTRLAAVCSAGLLPLGSIAEGARAGDGKQGGKDSDDAPPAPLPLSLLVVRGAAVAAPADCRGHAPAYQPEHRTQLQGALSAALRVLHSCYEPLPDSRTGSDMLPWLLRGAVLAGGEADYSAMHTALLYAGPAVVAVAVFRCFGAVAELPLLAVRPELQRRNGLGRLLLAAVEQLLLAAGAKVLYAPGFTAAGEPYLPATLPADGAAPQAAPALLQAKWGYRLAPAEQVLESCVHPLVRIPGVLLASKGLEPGTVLAPSRLPRQLQWSGGVDDARPLLRDGLVASVGSAAAAAALAAAAAPGKKSARPRREAAPAPGTLHERQLEQQQRQQPAQHQQQPADQRPHSLPYQHRPQQQQQAAPMTAQQQVAARQAAFFQHMSPEMAAAYQVLLSRVMQNPQVYALQQQQTALLLQAYAQQQAAAAVQHHAAVAAQQAHAQPSLVQVTPSVLQQQQQQQPGTVLPTPQQQVVQQQVPVLLPQHGPQ